MRSGACRQATRNTQPQSASSLRVRFQIFGMCPVSSRTLSASAVLTRTAFSDQPTAIGSRREVLDAAGAIVQKRTPVACGSFLPETNNRITMADNPVGAPRAGCQLYFRTERVPSGSQRP